MLAPPIALWPESLSDALRICCSLWATSASVLFLLPVRHPIGFFCLLVYLICVGFWYLEWERMDSSALNSKAPQRFPGLS